ncbi:MAG: lipid-binding SYLF domain-containing protein [Acidobacteria bacterium]|nr:lipid-binding SYLF domain-containing protein [Acidobacteriota bacterium]
MFSRSASLLALVVVFSGLAFGQGGKDLGKAVKRVNDASKVFREIMNAQDNAIPKQLLQDAKAIIVFPGALKAALGVGGQGGKGVAIRRMGNGWSAPAFVDMGGGSFGAQIGAEKTDYVLLIMNDKGLDGLMQDKFEVGAEASVTAGPVGRTAAASTNATLDAGILSYSRSKGLFAGAALKGVVISPATDINQAVYQKNARQILNEPVPASAAPASLQRFGETISGYVK